ncbi:MAG TPA: DNA translocase FtsK 4TM domain-containing protein, partial [Xanthomonadaceae bacterium]|nr:DNA translocase FtsK 4TM domain-containing protein [Xanthomonadaceae bacterium]
MARTARTPSRAAPAPPPPSRRFWHEIALVIFGTALLYLAASLLSYSYDDPCWSHAVSLTGALHNFGGSAGAYLADVAFYFCGYGAYMLPLVIGGLLWIALFGRDGSSDAGLTPALRLIGIVAFLISFTGLAYMRWGDSIPRMMAGGGGILGNAVGHGLSDLFGAFGSNLFLSALLLAAITLATGISWLGVMDAIGRGVVGTFQFVGEMFGRSVRHADEWSQARAARVEREEVRREDSERRAKREPVKIEPPAKPVIEKSERAKREQQIPLFNADPVGGLPPLSLLDDPKPQPKSYSEETLETLSRQIEFKLKDFKIDVTVVGAYPGPVITRFEMELAPGVKVSQISSLDKDIARGLSVKSVRVVDVIPGKNVIGLEIPNTHKQIVYLSEILRSDKYDQLKSPLALALG